MIKDRSTFTISAIMHNPRRRHALQGIPIGSPSRPTSNSRTLVPGSPPAGPTRSSGAPMEKSGQAVTSGAPGGHVVSQQPDWPHPLPSLANAPGSAVISMPEVQMECDSIQALLLPLPSWLETDTKDTPRTRLVEIFATERLHQSSITVHTRGNR